MHEASGRGTDRAVSSAITVWAMAKDASSTSTTRGGRPRIAKGATPLKPGDPGYLKPGTTQIQTLPKVSKKK